MALMISSILWLTGCVLCVLANTAIINFDRPRCANIHAQALEAATALSRTWPKLAPSTRPSLFTVQSMANSTSADYWLTLDLKGLENQRYTLRASYPANHPIELQMDVLDPQSMLGLDDDAVGGSAASPSTPHSVQSICPVFLRLRAATQLQTTLIPASTLCPHQKGTTLASQARWATQWLAEAYMGPLAPGQHRGGESGPSEASPVHLTLEPLVLFGTAPLGVCTTVVSTILIAVLVVSPFIWKKIQAALRGITPPTLHADTTE